MLQIIDFPVLKAAAVYSNCEKYKHCLVDPEEQDFSVSMQTIWNKQSPDSICTSRQWFQMDQMAAALVIKPTIRIGPEQTSKTYLKNRHST